MPGMAITVGADTRPFEAGMKAALGVAGQTAAQVGAKWAVAAAGIDKAMAQTARNVGVQFGREVASKLAPAALGLVGAIAAFEAAKLAIDFMGASVRAATVELERMAKVGADASRLGVSTTFLQTYSAQARALKVDADALVKSLETARAAFAVRQGEGGEGTRNDSTFGARLRQQMEAGNLTAGQVSRFDAAIGTEAKFRAALDIMTELQAKGRDLAALDLASKLFPPELVERIRSGAVDLARFRQMIDDVKNPDLVLLKPEEIIRAQELQRRLEEAQRTLDTAAKEFNLELARAGVGLREDAIAWKELMAGGARIAVSILQQARQIREQMEANEPAVYGRDYARPEDAPASGLKKDIGRTTSAKSTGDKDMDAALDKLRVGLGNPTLQDQAQAASRQMGEGLRRDQTKPIISTTPKRGGGGASPAESFDAVETYINQIERTTEALKAEAAAIGLSGGERLSAVNVAKLEATARQQGITLTQEQIDKVKALSIATDEYKTILQEATEAQTYVRSVGGELFRGMADDVRNGASAVDTLTNAMDHLLKRLSDRALDNLADVLFGKSGSGESGIFGSILSAFSGGIGGTGGSPTGGVRLFANGGIVSGPGTGTSDSIVARISNGEAIIPARVAATNRPLVQALVSDRLPKFAGGKMPDPAAFSAALRSGEAQLAGQPQAKQAQAAGQVQQAGAAQVAAQERVAAAARAEPVKMDINVSGARGNVEIMEMIKQGVVAGISQYDRRLNYTIGEKFADHARRER